MPRVAGRPLFVVLLVGLILLQALAFVGDAADLLGWLSPHSLVTPDMRSLGVPGAFAMVIAAAVLALRAYLLHVGYPGKWEVALGLSALKVGAGLFLLMAAGLVIWRELSLLLGIAGIAFLLQPSVTGMRDT
jgi:hypothetical protein